MRLLVIKVIKSIAKNRFTELLKSGAFPEINYRRTGETGYSYHMLPYSDTWATYMKLLDRLIKETLELPLGVFTRKHSKKLLIEIETLCANITEEDINNNGERFTSFADSVRGYTKEMIAKDRAKLAS